MDFDLIDVDHFGYAFNENVQRPALEQAASSLSSACARAKRDMEYRQVNLWQAGKCKLWVRRVRSAAWHRPYPYLPNADFACLANLEADDTWRSLRAKADRLEQLHFAAEQKIIMETAKAQARLPDGPIVYNGKKICHPVQCALFC